MDFDRKDLQKLYCEKVMPLQKRIMREKIITWSKIVILTLLNFFFFTLIYILLRYANGFVGLSTIFIVPVTLMFYITPIIINRFSIKIKKNIFPELFKSINNNLIYKSTFRFPDDKFSDSELYDLSNSRFESSDFIYTKINNKDTEIYEVVVKCKSGRSEQEVFSGIFVNIKLDNYIKCNLKITSNIFKDYGLFKTMFSNENKINLENIDFEKKFDVYCDNQIYVRRVITLSFMEKLLDFKNKINKEFEISFKNNNIYIAIEEIQLINDRNLFFKKNDIMMIINTVYNIFEIIEMIKLLDLEEAIV